MADKLRNRVRRMFAAVVMVAMLLSAGACEEESRTGGSSNLFKSDKEENGFKVGGASEIFKPSGIKVEKKYTFEETEPSEPVVYDAEKLSELKKMLKDYSVEYGYDELFDYEKAIEGISVDHTVTGHTYSALDDDGKLTKQHLYEIVQKNSKEYLNDASSIIKEVDKTWMQDMCEIITDVTNYMLETYPEIDKERVYCNLGNLKIVEKLSAMDYAAVEAEMVLHVNRSTAKLLDYKADASMYNVIVHETMHILQFGCSCEMKNGCERRCGLAHYYDGHEPQYADWIWLGEGSAERMACLYMGANPMTYYNHVNYILTMDLATTLREDIPGNYVETIYFFHEPERLYSAFDAVTEEEKQEIYKLIYALNIMQAEPEGVKQAYYDNYGVEWTDEVRDDVFNKIKRPILQTITKTFFTNLADVLLKNEVSKNDVLFLLNLYESTMNQHLHFDNQKYDGYNEGFVEWYKTYRAEFFACFENMTSDEYAAYVAGDGETTINATINWLPKEKTELLTEKYEAHQCKYKMN